MAARTQDEIRASIEQNRQQLGMSIEKLREEVVELTDWRTQLKRNEQALMIGAAATGFVLGGGIAGAGGLVFGRKRRKVRRRAKKAAKLALATS